SIRGGALTTSNVRAARRALKAFDGKPVTVDVAGEHVTVSPDLSVAHAPRPVDGDAIRQRLIDARVISPGHGNGLSRLPPHESGVLRLDAHARAAIARELVATRPRA